MDGTGKFSSEIIKETILWRARGSSIGGLGVVNTDKINQTLNEEIGRSVIRRHGRTGSINVLKLENNQMTRLLQSEYDENTPINFSTESKNGALDSQELIQGLRNEIRTEKEVHVSTQKRLENTYAQFQREREEHEKTMDELEVQLAKIEKIEQIVNMIDIWSTKSQKVIAEKGKKQKKTALRELTGSVAHIAMHIEEIREVLGIGSLRLPPLKLDSINLDKKENTKKTNLGWCLTTRKIEVGGNGGSTTRRKTDNSKSWRAPATDRVTRVSQKTRGKQPIYYLTLYGSQLSPYEKKEIQHFPRIYYIGKASQKIWARSDKKAYNYGFDDENSSYNVSKQRGDHVFYRYEIISILGEGSFGCVYKAVDHKLSKVVAIKIVRNNEVCQQQAVVENDILKELSNKSKQAGIVKILHSFWFRSHFCFVFPLLSINLYELIIKTSYRGFSLSTVRAFGKQLLKSLDFLSTKGIIHCDIKPENICLRSRYKHEVCLIDFGCSCHFDEQVYTYIQSRYYRAPEVILGYKYTAAIDTWSFGCMLYEFHTGQPLFPANDESDLFDMLVNLLGYPPAPFFNNAERRDCFSTENAHPSECEGGRDLRSLDSALVDVILRCLRWDPEDR